MEPKPGDLLLQPDELIHVIPSLVNPCIKSKKSEVPTIPDTPAYSHKQPKWYVQPLRQSDILIHHLVAMDLCLYHDCQPTTAQIVCGFHSFSALRALPSPQNLSEIIVHIVKTTVKWKNIYSKAFKKLHMLCLLLSKPKEKKNIMYMLCVHFKLTIYYF